MKIHISFLDQYILILGYTDRHLSAYDQYIKYRRSLPLFKPSTSSELSTRSHDLMEHKLEANNYILVSSSIELPSPCIRSEILLLVEGCSLSY